MAASGVAGQEVLEVGAGLGALTHGLARQARRTVAVELDRQLVAALHALFPEVEVVAGDILQLPVGEYFPAGGHVVAGNIPYYLSGALLRRLLEEPPRPARLALVVQREVAERWLGAGGWSLSTVVVHTLAEPRPGIVLAPEVFYPAPQVSSQQVILETRERPVLGVGSLGDFFRFAERVFQQRRKQLQASLGRLSGEGSTAAAAGLAEMGIDPQLRPETLRLPEWELLYRRWGGGPRES